MIGILAGMGPKSTGPFVDLVVEQCQAVYGAKDDMDFPHMMIYSCPTPFYIDKPINHKEMEQAIITGAKRLEKTGVDFIAMPCNTAHLYIDQLKEMITVPIINMVEESIKALPQSSHRTALLATEATVQSGIYEQGLSELEVNYIHKPHWQTMVNQLIAAIKSEDVNVSYKLWSQLEKELDGHVDTAIIACTDINVVSHKKWSHITLVDSATCLARAAIHKYLSKEGKE
ncbi:amino acid racemase [Bacillus spongiae]|uniref:Amino acid racemase n=1 Tax=Bacillus spongiae TaxID=2683610 RepID=A0ABU8HDD0_9BACI